MLAVFWLNLPLRALIPPCSSPGIQLEKILRYIDLMAIIKDSYTALTLEKSPKASDRGILRVAAH
jgi:hypothetical protein